MTDPLSISIKVESRIISTDGKELLMRFPVICDPWKLTIRELVDRTLPEALEGSEVTIRIQTRKPVEKVC